MNFKEIIDKRYSVRNFSDKKVEEEKLFKILDAGRIAPTGRNDQANRIFVVNSEENLKKIDLTSKSRYKAPLALIFGYDKNIRKATEKRGSVDCAIAVTYSMLQACDLGLGTCWVRAFDSDKLREIFKIDENIELTAMLMVGYENEDNIVKRKERKPLEEIVTFIE